MSSAWEQAGQELESSRLFVHADAASELEEGGIPFPSDQQDEARNLLDDASTPVWVAVLPEAAGSTQDSVRDLARTIGQDGTYVAVLSNGSADAVSNVIDDARNAAVSVSRLSDDMPELVEGLVTRFENLAANGSGSAGAGSSDPGGGSSGLLPLAILAVAGGGGFLLYRRNKRNRERAQLEEVREALDEDITAYGERLTTLDLDVETDSRVPVEARNEYGRALDLYENAKVYADRAEKPDDLKAVTNALEEGRWLLGCVDSRLNGKPLPERRAPCFFDPRHGPSVEDVTWAPPGGVNRTVPACAADAIRIKDGHDPDTRLVPVADGERRPYWDAGPAYGAWAAGYYGAAVLPAMMVGTMLGTSMAAPLAYGGTGAEGGDFGGGFDGGGGDFGGGFGGGGGDFGGGFDGGF